MGLLYAYLIDLDISYEYRISFVNRETADEWWRMISTAPSRYAGKIKRSSPQLYSHKGVQATGDLRYFQSTSGSPDATRFERKVFIRYLNAATTIPAITITDHVSGRWFFIQSKAEPSSHWYVRIKGACLVCGDANCDAVHVSSEYKTKFCIRAHDAPDGGVEDVEDFIMIGKDKISISAPKGHILHIDDEEDVKATKGYQGETNLLFGDLKNRFITHAVKQVNGEVWEYVIDAERGSGETWELVD